VWEEEDSGQLVAVMPFHPYRRSVSEMDWAQRQFLPSLTAVSEGLRHHPTSFGFLM
jgi:hypothetical protein